MTRILIPALALAAFAACETADTQVAPPTLSDTSSERSVLDIVDRAAALEGAMDFDLASVGQAVDLADSGSLMAFSLHGMVETDGLPTERDVDNEYANIFAGGSALVFAETVRYAVVGPPSIAIAFAANGEVTQVESNVWVATNTVDLPEGPLTTTFTVAWVGVGWLGEMRFSDATHSDALWFNGFVGFEGNLGWWDLYDGNTKVGVVEWIGDGQGNGHFGIGVVAGEHDGSALFYTLESDQDRIDFVDGNTGETAWVQGNADGSGEVRLVDFNEGQVACWGADNVNTDCAAE